MKTLKTLVTAAFFFSICIGFAQEKSAGTVNVEISNISNEKGIIMVGLYNSESTWLNKIYTGTTSEIKNGKATASFTNIPNGTYAVGIYHDEDVNGKLNMFLGMFPTEDSGASNNAPAKFGPPKWKDAKFEINGNTINQHIKL